jgi:cell wall-associated NlpC family hydrolase
MDGKVAKYKEARARKRVRRKDHLRRAVALKRGIDKLTGWIARRRQKLAAQGAGGKAVAYALKFEGRTESPAGSNDAPFLADWRRALGATLAWMKGQPWCGFGCLAAWFLGAGLRLPDGCVYTPNIVAWANRGEHFTRVRPEDARPGDWVVFNFVGGSSVADHVGLALGPARGGMIPTIEPNTSPSNSGSQANGGGMFRRSRPVGLIACVARPKGV